ncbi:unnamed protein product [Linum trigynum]|uniref:peroxidase n=1 Tax=Linum trigynum TaxID=586398 RepID=A0AAV2D154_9ROSI
MNLKFSSLLLPSSFLVLVLIIMATSSSPNLFINATGNGLRVGFYARTCPDAESLVRTTVRNAVADDPSIAARLLRLFFHDCFVQSDGPRYEVPTGRRDGRVSKPSLAANLPEVDDSIELLKAKFEEKGLNAKDLVLLTAGAHTIGSAACLFMTKRLYNFTGKSDSDPAINSRFLRQLKSACPLGRRRFERVPLDWSSEFKFDDSSLRNIVNGTAVLASDARLADDSDTRRALLSYAGPARGHQADFGPDFAASMVKLGYVGVKMGRAGEIRRKCDQVN